ncbi:MAG: GAF domain-containing sensor histidine kinase [bacterium]|nr:GAF domain-containing sensor histidine kinase [bacterium]
MEQPKIDIILKKITLLNQTALDSMPEKDDKVIIKNFILNGIKILGADFGWAWWKDGNGFKLAYKSPGVPFDPPLPRPKGGNYIALKTKKPFFDSEVKKENYMSLGIPNVHDYIKSYVIIPIYYGDKVYGSLMFCYKKHYDFTQNELVLAEAIGNTAAQAMTIHRFVEIDVLLAQEKLKTEFIANTTHEFRTPLTIMRGYIYLATKKNELKAMKNALKDIDTEIVNLSELLSDLVLITSGRTQKIQLVPVSVTEIAQRAAVKLNNFAREKGIAIIQQKNEKEIMVLGDEKYLERVFLNLVRNAITYGGTKIEVAVEANKNSVRVEIKDDGIGIDRNDLPHIFERFFRVDKSHNRDGGHSGLGLPIAKWVINLHNGKINVKSSLGKGSTFTVTLPRTKLG